MADKTVLDAVAADIRDAVALYFAPVKAVISSVERAAEHLSHDPSKQDREAKKAGK